MVGGAAGIGHSQRVKHDGRTDPRGSRPHTARERRNSSAETSLVGPDKENDHMLRPLSRQWERGEDTQRKCYQAEAKMGPKTMATTHCAET